MNPNRQKKNTTTTIKRLNPNRQKEEQRVRNLSNYHKPQTATVLLVHAHHDARHLRASDDGREDRPGGIVPGKASLAHTAAVVHHQRGNLAELQGL